MNTDTIANNHAPARRQRLLNADRYSQHAVDRWEYRTGLEAQRLGLAYALSLNDGERAAVDAVSLYETRRVLLPHGRAVTERKHFRRRRGLARLPESRTDSPWADERAEVWGGLLTVVIVVSLLLVVNLLIAPFVLCAWAARGRRR